jgi:hypothetical protein
MVTRGRYVQGSIGDEVLLRATYDLEAYAEGLSNIGFRPLCPSQCELRYDDLDFMRVLHRRYLHREITGEGHPFEP